MPWVGFQPTIPNFEQAKAVHALDRAVTVIEYKNIVQHINLFPNSASVSLSQVRPLPA
jgi:hypothetical protein